MLAISSLVSFKERVIRKRPEIYQYIGVSLLILF